MLQVGVWGGGSGGGSILLIAGRVMAAIRMSGSEVVEKEHAQLSNINISNKLHE